MESEGKSPYPTLELSEIREAKGHVFIHLQIPPGLRVR